MLQPAHVVVSPATPSREPWLKPSRPTSAPRRKNAATIDAAPPPAPVPLPPPSAPRSCVHTASLDPCNSPAMAAPDPHARSRSQVPRHTPQIAIHCHPFGDDTSQPPVLVNLVK